MPDRRRHCDDAKIDSRADDRGNKEEDERG
jgi:hypothetical protein